MKWRARKYSNSRPIGSKSNTRPINLYYYAAYRTPGFVSQALNISAYFPAYLSFEVTACLALHVAYLAPGIAIHH
ncbi:MAG: hypothetical protein WCH01_16040 [Methylococcaceae bacterium]